MSETYVKVRSDSKNAVIGSMADRLRMSRRRSGLSQSTLARMVGVSPSAATQWENPNGTEPSLQNLVSVARATGVSVEWLLTGNGSRGRAPVQESDDAVAVTLDSFAHNVEEETLLAVFRRLPSRSARLLIEIAQEFAVNIQRGPRKRR